MKMTVPKKNVYDALQERLKYIFDTFEYIYVSFSGGKDSGILLNACIQYIRENNIKRKIGVFHLDYEVQYNETITYIDRVLESNQDLLDIFRVCIPVKVPSCTSMFQQFWRPWDPEMKDSWVRKRPEKCFTQQDFSFYTPKMWDYEFHYRFAQWIKNKKKVKRVACLVGIRTQESLNRWRAIYYPKNYYSTGKARWINKSENGTYNVYPIFDWLTKDVWIANGKFKWDYNHIYDLYYYAGVPIEQQRVASPFISQAIASLHLYRALDPDLWGKMICRVNGVNFAGIYGKSFAMGWRAAKLPKGMSWKTYLNFLLQTLPKDIQQNYINKLNVSKKFWREKGGCLNSSTIKALKAKGIPIHVGKNTNYKTKKLPVRMEYQDDINIPEFRELPSYKRMCICILKNDHYCKYMGFSITKKGRDKRRQIMKEYESYFMD